MNINKLNKSIKLIKDEKGQLWICKINRNKTGIEARWVISVLEKKNMTKKNILESLSRAIESVQKEDRNSEIWVCKVVPKAKGKEKWVCSLVRGYRSPSLRAPKKK